MARSAPDARVTRLLDPAGFVKGWAAELAAQAPRSGRSAALVPLRRRRHPDSWYERRRLAVARRHRRPEQRRSTLRVAAMVEVAMRRSPRQVLPLADVTCGTAAPVRPAEALASMTVIGPHLTWADAFATTAFVMGLDGLDWVAQFDGYRARGHHVGREVLRRDEQWVHAASMA